MSLGTRSRKEKILGLAIAIYCYVVINVNPSLTHYKGNYDESIIKKDEKTLPKQ